MTGPSGPSTVTAHGDAFLHACGSGTQKRSLAHVGTDSVDASPDARDIIRVDAIDVAGGSGSDHRWDGGAQNHRIAFRIRPLPLGLDRVFALFHDLCANIRKAFRHLWKEVVLTGRLGWFRDGVRVVWRRGQGPFSRVGRHEPAHPVSRNAGHLRRSHDGSDLCHCGRYFFTCRTR